MRDDVGPALNGVDIGGHLGHQPRVGPGAAAGRNDIAVVGEEHPEVEPLERRRDRDRLAVVPLDRSLGHDPPIFAAGLVRPPRDEQARLVGMRLPGPAGVAEAHEDHLSVAIDIAHPEPRGGRLARFWPYGGPDDPSFPQRRLDAVRAQARKDIDAAGVDEPLDALVLVVVAKERPDEVERGDPARPLERVHVAVDEQGRLFDRRARRPVGDRHEPELAPSGCRPDAPELEDIGPGGGPALQQRRQFVVVEDMVERKLG